jgi:hypothetical protein
MSGFVNQADLIKVLFNLNQKVKIFFVFKLGKGIYLVRDVEGLKAKFAEIDTMDKKKQISVKPMKRVIQRFVLFD